MLRIAKSTPGVLDLSAVKDEHGLPVTLIGPSHRDVPDHEESNPVLQRIVELRWVTVTRAPLEIVETAGAGVPEETNDEKTGSSEGIGNADTPSASTETSIDSPLHPSVPPDIQDTVLDTSVEPTQDEPDSPPPLSVQPDAQDTAPDTGVEPIQDKPISDAPAKLESYAKPYGKSDTRKAGRRS